MTLKTPLYDQHIEAQGKMVDFAGWQMPIHYGSQIKEHQVVREEAGMFDVSHMLAVDIRGENSQAFLSKLLANDIQKLYPGKALYSCMLNNNGGVIDDLIVYCVEDSHYRVVVNAGTRDKDIAWMQQHAESFQVRITPRTELAIIAVQGPKAECVIQSLSEGFTLDGVVELKKFHATQCQDIFVGRTGYTGEDGFEIMLPAEKAPELWYALLEQGVKPCGLGSRDTLRLEAGMNLYGSDMDDSVTPLESNLSWTVDFSDENRGFIGKEALLAQKNDLARKLVGIVLTDKGVMRNGQKVVTQFGDGVITSGTFSPTLQKSIALARIPVEANENIQIEIRQKLLSAELTKVPFV